MSNKIIFDAFDCSNIDIIVPKTRDELLEIALGGKDSKFQSVGYDIPGKGYVEEATVVKCKNGASINYTDVYMRRRDPECMYISDDKPSDKIRFKDFFKYDFNDLRKESFDWLKKQDKLLFMPFYSGGMELKAPSLLVAPINAGFFAGGLSDLQYFLTEDELPSNFKPEVIIYLAPTFRHTHFDGRQIVVHNRLDSCYEMFSFNLYPGPSAKKGVYGALLHIGEEQGWTTLHASTVKVHNTSSKRDTVIMHEGASGGGKSEMIQSPHIDEDNQLLIGENIKTKERIQLDYRRHLVLNPVTDDMALATADMQKSNGKLTVSDGENGWFIRVDHILQYGTEPMLEKLTIHPPHPLIFLNLDGKEDATCLIWEHSMDEPGKRCPNPRAVIPRDYIPNIVKGTVDVDIRSFGFRAPPCTIEKPTYGILGLFHIIPPALAWLWRLVSPRGHANPSISEQGGFKSEGIGSYWPFLTGKKINQANILLNQILSSPETHYIVTPNQHVGAYKTSFAPQWIAREYITEKGFKFDKLVESKCSLLGYIPETIEVLGKEIPSFMFDTSQQKEVGEETYNKGKEILTDFFKEQLKQYMMPDLDPRGKKIIDIFLKNGSVKDYEDAVK